MPGIEEMVAGLRMQRDLLKNLMAELEGKQTLDHQDRRLYDAVTKQVEQNLRKLRKSKADSFRSFF